MRQVSEVLCVRSTFKKDKLYDGKAAELLKDVMGSLEEVWVSRRGAASLAVFVFMAFSAASTISFMGNAHPNTHERELRF